jgi:hypothetical protein
MTVHDYLIPENVIPPLETTLDNGVHFFFINGVLLDII